jgi:copper(I)-binding protein
MLSSRSARALRGLAVAAVTVLVPAAAGCEAGTNAPTQQWHQPTPGASTVINQIAINNVFVLGAPPQTWLAPGKSAGLFLALANDGKSADRLVSISAPGSATSVLLPKGGIPLASRQSVLLQGPAPQILLQQLTRSLVGGQSVPVTLNFQNAGSVTLHVPVIPQASAYATFSAAPASPAASPSPASTGKHHKANASPTPTPSASPTG